ncbi:MAG: hypothetical protein HY712_06110 [candidate division NC10 bacterium]|nr:hypothetical protein [candidate division NC10 bacterium]
MVPEMELWSPEQELRLLEEIAESEANAFEFDLGPSIPPAVAQAERVWVAYWKLPQNGFRSRARTQLRPVRGR